MNFIDQQMLLEIWEHLRPVIEIAILTVLFYRCLYFLRETRGAHILAGLVIVLIIFTILSDIAKFDVISWLLKGLWTAFAAALIVIFQPELRRAFAQLGSRLSRG